MSTNKASENQDISRRQFLKTSSAAAVGTGLLGGLSIERCAWAAGDDTIKVALVGCGGRGSGAADQALSTSGSVKLIAMADAFRSQLDNSHRTLLGKHKDRVEVPEENKFVGLDAFQKAIPLADVVILATPPGFRSFHFEEAVKNNKHIFMEKPVATDGPGIQRVLAAAEIAKNKNLKVGVGLQRRHQQGYIETLNRLHDGAIGDITSMRCYWNGGPVGPKAVRTKLAEKLGRAPTEMEYQIANWYMFAWICGDHIVEQHIHNLDVINWVKKGYPVRAEGMGGRAYQKGPDSGEIFDHHAVEYEYEDGSRCFSYCRQIPNTWSSVSEAVVGTKGACQVDKYTIRGETAWKYAVSDKEPDPYQVEHDDFFRAIRQNTPYNEAERGAMSSMTAILGRMATYSGKVVEMKDALASKLRLAPDQFTWDAQPKSQPGPDGLYPYPIPGSTIAF